MQPPEQGVALYRVLSCLTAQHDYRLVALAALICAAAALASFNIYSHVAASRGLRRSSLLLLTGICSAFGIWATHFIAMLAYESGLPIAYDPATTAGSLLIAVVATTFGFAVAASARRWQPAIGGAVDRRRHRPDALHRHAGAHRSGYPAMGHPRSSSHRLVIGVALASTAMVGFHRLKGRRALVDRGGLCSPWRSAACTSPPWAR